jgi:uncharacterized membrane protein
MSRQAFDRIAIALGVVASAIAAYLTLIHYEEDLLVCSVVEGCETVQSSAYATIGPIPVALLGLVSALGMVLVAVGRAYLPEQRFTTSAVLTGMLLFSLLYLIYLTYIEIFVIEAICQWCVAYMIVVAIWLGFEIVNLRREFVAEDDPFGDD